MRHFWFLFAVALAAAKQPVQFAAPVYFEKNIGQASRDFVYLARAGGTELAFTADAVVTGGAAIRLTGSNPRAPFKLEDPQPGVSNYLAASGESHTQVPHFSRLRRDGIYPGIDVVYYGSGGRLEYDFIVQAGADPSQVWLEYQGEGSLAVDVQGDLVWTTASGQFRQHRPVAYQPGGRRVAAAFVIHGSAAGFELGPYDPAQPLTIDPALVYSTFLGSDSGGFFALEAMTVDASGSVYVTGTTNGGASYPTTPDAYQRTWNNFPTPFVTKLSPDGSSLVYSTFINGRAFLAITVDASGSVYLAGRNCDARYPMYCELDTVPTPGAYQGNPGITVVKLSPAGDKLIYSARIGGGANWDPLIIRTDPAGSAVVCGSTSEASYPTTAGAYRTTARGGTDAVLTKLSLDGSTLVFSTYLGGGGDDTCGGMAIDGVGSIYVSGTTKSLDFPVSSGAFRTSFPGASAGFAAKFSASGAALLYSTFLGDTAGPLYVDSAGDAFVSGTAASNFPSTPNAYRSQVAPGGEAFVAKLNPSGSALLAGTLIGAASAALIGVAPDGSPTITGVSSGTPFPTTPDSFQPTSSSSRCPFLLRFDAAFAILRYSTYFCGNEESWSSPAGALDPVGNAYLAGGTASPIFPTTSGAFQRAFPGRPSLGTAYIAKFGLAPDLRLASIVSDPPGIVFTLSGNQCPAGQYTAPASLTWPAGVSCTIMWNSPMPLGPNVRYKFSKWVDGSTQNPRFLTDIAGGVTYRASFAHQYRIAPLVSPPGAGTVTVNPASSDGFYNIDDVLTVTGFPAPGFAQSGWGGDVVGAGGSLKLTVPDAALNVTANFSSAGCTYKFDGPSFVPGWESGGWVTFQVTGSNCSWTVSSDSSWMRLTGNPSGSGSGHQQVSLHYSSGFGVRAGRVWVGGQSGLVIQTGMPPTYFGVVEMWPNTTTKGTEVLTIWLNNPKTSEDFETVHLLISEVLASPGSCYLRYKPSTQTFWLLDDSGSGWIGPVSAATSDSLQNSQCTVSMDGNATVTYANTFLLIPTITLKPGFSGKKNIFVNAYYPKDPRTGASQEMGWRLIGSWWNRTSTGSLVNWYRLFDPGSRTHHYTTDRNEYDTLALRGFVAEGVGGRLYNGPTDQGTPWYRIYVVPAMSHFWTADRNEYLTLIRNPAVYVGEGIDGLVSPSADGSAQPLYRLAHCCASPPIHHWTQDAHENAVLAAQDWVAEGIAAYVYPAAGSPPPRPRSAIAVVNAATYERTPIAPGSLFRIAGAGFSPAEAVTLGGKPAHIVSITDREIVAVAPEVEPGSATVQAGRETATVRIAPESPGIFAKDSFGRGQARLRNEDGSMNSVENPAAKGSTVTLYVTGVRQPVIRVGGFPALVDRIERSAPGERAVRFTVPAGTEAGAAVPITIESGAHPGQQGVTIAVRD